jgi:hypothetical protein
MQLQLNVATFIYPFLLPHSILQFTVRRRQMLFNSFAYAISFAMQSHMRKNFQSQLKNTIMKHIKNIVTKGLSGRIQELVFRQNHGKTYVVSSPAPSTVPASEQQLQIRFTFKDAVRYAKAILTDAAIKLAYKAKADYWQSAFNMAIADFFKPPTIGTIITSAYTVQAGSFVTAQVTDDFQVASVEVRIEKSNGQLVEAGAAVLMEDGLHYKYTSTAAVTNITGNKITFIATDLPGHLITKQVIL